MFVSELYIFMHNYTDK